MNRTEREKERHEDTAINLVRNALLVAGHEMGEEGDHAPVITATIHQIMKDREEARINRATDAEMKIHLYQQLGIMESELPRCDASIRALAAQKLATLRETLDAYFAPTNETVPLPPDDELPLHIRRAKEILKTLEEPDER